MKVPITWVTLFLAITVDCNYKYLAIESFTWQGLLASCCIGGLIGLIICDTINTYIPKKEDEEHESD
jgi:hypothetical protein